MGVDILIGLYDHISPTEDVCHGKHHLQKKLYLNGECSIHNCEIAGWWFLKHVGPKITCFNYSNLSQFWMTLGYPHLMNPPYGSIWGFDDHAFEKNL